MAPKAAWVVYALIDPRSGEVRYIGCTCNLAQRLMDHHKLRATESRQPRAQWLSTLKDLGLRPNWCVLEDGHGDWEEAERRWIAAFIAAGAALTNRTTGGAGVPGRLHTDDAKASMSAKRKGVKPSPLAAQRTRELRTGVPRPAEVMEPMHAAVRGVPKSAEHRAKLAAAQSRFQQRRRDALNKD